MLDGPWDWPAMSGWKSCCIVSFHSSSDGVGSRILSTVSNATSTGPPLPPTGFMDTFRSSPCCSLTMERTRWRDQSPGVGMPAAFSPP